MRKFLEGGSGFGSKSFALAVSVGTLFVLVLSLTVGCAGDAPTDKTGLALVDEACSPCHSVARLYLLEESNQWDWQSIVPRMVEQHSAGVGGKELSKRQQDDIVQALENREPSAGEVAILANCTTCHSINKVTGRYVITMWADMMDRMEGRYGAEFSDADREAMMQFFEEANTQAQE